MEKAKDLIGNLMKKEISPLSFALIFTGMIIVRGFLEQFVALSKPITPIESIVEFLHNFYFFLLTFLLLWALLAFVLKIKPQKLLGLIVFGLFLAVLPPIFDMAKMSGQVYWSFYLLSSPAELWRQYISVFGHLPSGIVYFGTKIAFILAIAFTTGITWILTKSFLKTIFTAFISYSILFFMGSFPTIFYYFYSFFTGRKVSDIHSFDIAGFFGGFQKILGVEFPSFQYVLAYHLNFIYFLLLLLILSGFFYFGSRQKFLAYFKNLRPPQIIYHFGLFFAGIGLGILAYPRNFNLNIFSILEILVMIAGVWLSWEASVVANDIYDLEIDKISNPARPLPQNIFSLQQYKQFGIILFLLSILGGLTVGIIFTVLLLVYQIIAWFYSAEPLRLKKYPGVATLTSSLASVIILFLGYILVSEDQTIHTLSWRIILLLIIAYTISLPLKDFKDIEGDKKCKIWTIPVLLSEKKARLLVAINLFISFILSVFFLNDLRLFWWAMPFGTLAFLVVNYSKNKPRQLFFRILFLVAIYGIILVRTVFS